EQRAVIDRAYSKSAKCAARAVLLVFLFLFACSAYPQSPQLTLDRVVSMYVERNLELQVARYRLERTKAGQNAARLRPQPRVSVTGENFRVSGPIAFGNLYEVATTYSETIELGGKQAARQRAAAATVSAAEARFADAMRQGVAEVKRLYFQAVLAR